MLRGLVPDLPAPAALLPYLEKMHARRWHSNFGPMKRRFTPIFHEVLRDCGLAQVPPPSTRMRPQSGAAHRAALESVRQYLGLTYLGLT